MSFNFNFKFRYVRFQIYFTFVVGFVYVFPVNSTNVADLIGMVDDMTLATMDNLEQNDSTNSQTRMTNIELLTAASVFSDISAPLWNNTKAPVGRDILYHIPYKLSSIQYGGVTANIFVNVTGKMNVVSGNILSLKQNEEQLKSVFELFMEAVPEDEASSVTPILQRITISEYKVGALLQGGFVKNLFNIQLHIPILAGIRHFWLSRSDQKDLERIFSRYENNKLDISEFYRIRYGLGDTRLKLGCNTLNMTDFQTDVGFEIIIPSSRLSYNPKLQENPDDLFAKINGDAANDDIQESMATIIRGVRDYMLDPKLGNGYFGIGAYLESKFDVFHDLAHLWVRASYDKLFPAVEYRPFMFKVTMSPYDLKDKSAAELRNGIMQDFVKQYILPASFKSEVYPGGVFNFVFAISTLIRRINLALGYDYYAQQREKITRLYNTKTALQSLRVEDTEASSVEQHKIFIEASYVKNLKRVDLGIGLGGDVTVHSSGIGDDWTVYLKVSGTF